MLVLGRRLRAGIIHFTHADSSLPMLHWELTLPFAMSSGGNISIGVKFQDLVDLMARLRAPGGCPWDREQTFDTIKPFLLEETYEVMDAIDARDWKGLSGEIGDLLLQAIFFSQMAAEENLFTIGDAIDSISNKLVRRHPHVFGDETAHTEGDVRKRWSEIKAEEKKEDGKPEATLLDGVPRALPALVEAQQISSRAAQVGFDWNNADEVLAKLDEERAEFERATPAEKEDELGDMLFVLVNLARFVKVDPEQALRRTNAKFRRRFGFIERELQARGKSLAESSVQEMENLWQESKL
ncbi:MAG: nucleoside triphosphate pyrophosphohydrolase [Acidobacteriota bacterium]|nr:nucleoside triphosphate pyrophosphohydrolase [Acidobacteriota bacterium]